MIHMQKKGEIPSTVFIYAITAVIVGFILIFGYQSITKLGTTVSKTDTAKFKTELRNTMISDTSYGKNEVLNIGIPAGYVELCFVAADSLAGNDLLTRYPQAQDVAESADNAFLADEKGNLDPFKLNPFEIGGSDTAALCIRESNGNLRFRLEGKGRTVKVSSV